MNFLEAPDAESIRAHRRGLFDQLRCDIIAIVAAARKKGVVRPAVIAAIEVLQEIPKGPSPELMSWYFDLLDTVRHGTLGAVEERLLCLPNTIALSAAKLPREGGVVLDLLVDQPLNGAPATTRFPQLAEQVRVRGAGRFEAFSGRTFVDGEPFPMDDLIATCRTSPSPWVHLWLAGEALDGLLQRFRNPGRGERGADLSVLGQFELQDKRYSSLVEKLVAAVDLTRAVDPALGAEVCESTTGYAFLSGTHLVGASDFRLLGVTLLRMDPKWTVLTFADHVVHEAAHHSLFIGTELRPLVTNPSEPCPSPIRREERQVLGAVHATFVFQRLVRFFLAVCAAGVNVPEATARLHRHLLGLELGVAVLRKHAKFTPAGSDWVDVTDRWCRDIISSTGGVRSDLASESLGDYDSLDQASALAGHSIGSL